ncbi:RagB/SusD family nutrient uptake outer membrane protein [Sinomicrobium weinanense]|uniref:RagB/SusD family nutrient uptake outer membrane protein n=1 Tax=Sinomicrobium weinanense TaxID=2842200 RepID=A0A926JPK1_9FLAO|nr:RagB/SusD family nutrient uptake outer membrane protein [Sinomicrobium weinanense]MBC9795031.1 RagB/SusD family nutrient uptake outer membrane protein [Sinomicrobium weinanense]MBU3125108.1 RagB/SusD family nutrient uptake outer membrane protein [Sinomicrobium weinanense]
MKNITRNIFTIGFIILAFSCTDLDVDEKDSIVIPDTDEGFGGVNPGEALGAAYIDIRNTFNTQEALYALSEVSTDEMLVPTRGTDWGDNGVWRVLHEHTWDPTHRDVLSAWNRLNSNVFRLNQLLAPQSQASTQQAAEAKFLRAFSMFHVMDLYGQVPFREADEGVEVDPRVMTASEAFDFIINDLNEALADLPSTSPGAGTIKASKAAANFLLAKLYLNKHIYKGTGNPEAADMTMVIQAVDAIKNDGFDLQEGFFDLFKNDPDNETIWYTDAGVDTRMWNGLHYHQVVPDNDGGGWNGFSTLAEFYNLFEGDPETNVAGSGQEERRGFVPDIASDNIDDTNYGIGYGFLVGQQYGVAKDNNNKIIVPLQPIALNDRPGNPLVFTKDFPALVGNNERTGIRVLKYHPANGAFATGMIIFRYADAHLMKAEAILRGGSSGEDATALVNELRTLRKASTLSSVDLETLLDERGRELYNEGWRRNDMIRFGAYTGQWEFKENTEEFRVLYPIPATALVSNPNLEQNPGY